MKKISSVTQKGQVTIPQVVREKLGIQYGDKVAFSFNDSGDIILTRVSADLNELYGVLEKKALSKNSEEMRRNAWDWVAEQKGRG